ncbi:MAG: hypothetical protein HY870_14410, partial [Chloroflexi bacterium]|nr:hypothetical protein [Chloroflexota bacterium]
MLNSKTYVVSCTLFASLALVLGLVSWLQGLTPFRVAQADGLIDDSFLDFSGGTGCFVRASGVGGLDGEVIVSATVDTDFPGNALPAGWFSTTIMTLVSGGQLIVNEGAAGTSDTFAPGQTLEFTATFEASFAQIAGFGVEVYSIAPFAIFYSNGTDLLVRTNAGSGETPVNLGTSYFGSPHHYRIDWGTSEVIYYINGTAVVTDSVAIATSMSVLFQDVNDVGTTLNVDWARLWPWVCTYGSRVIDSGLAGSSFTGLSTTLVTPVGAAIAFEVITST